LMMNEGSGRTAEWRRSSSWLLFFFSFFSLSWCDWKLVAFIVQGEFAGECVHSVVLCDWRRSIGMKWQVCCCCLCRRSLNSCSRRRRRRTVVESNLVDGEVDDLRQSKRGTTTMMTKERRYGNFSLLTSFRLLLLFMCQQVSLAAVHHQRISGNILYSSSFRSSSYCRVLQNVLLFTLSGSRFPAETVWGLSTLSYNVLLISSHSSSLQIWGREEDTSWRFGLVLQSAWAELAYDTLECLTSIVIKKCWMREGT
jgi:hypothetical protein